MKVTVAIVTRNRANDLKECLNSLVQQTKHPDQILIIDNASEDNTKKTVEDFKIDNLQYVYCKEVGVSYARNAALNNCRNEIISFLDDDSVAKSDWVSQNEECFQKNTNIIGIQGYIDNYYPRKSAAILTQFQRDLIDEISVSNCLVIKPTFCAAGNLSFRMDFLKNNNLRFNTDLDAGEEQGICRNILQNDGKIYYLKESVIYHKWKKNPFEYLKRRFKTGLSQAVQERVITNTDSEEFVSGYSKVEILQKALNYTSKYPKFIQFKIITLLLISNIAKKIGYLFGRISSLD